MSVPSWRKALKEPDLSAREIGPPVGRVAILHPHLKRELLSFPAYPQPQEDGDEPRHVVYYPVVIDACRIITNFVGADPHLVLAGGARISANTIFLPAGRYYLNLETAQEQRNYEIVTQFAAWTYPHDDLPAHWRSNRAASEQAQLDSNFMNATPSSMSKVVVLADKKCPITDYDSGFATQNVHIVPEDQDDWFTGNDMHRYGVGRTQESGINNVANGMTLRSDVQLILDNHGFLLFPISNTTVIHMVLHNENYTELLHWREVSISKRVSREFLYARFAYTIINLVPKSTRLAAMQVEVPESVKLAEDQRLKLKVSKKRKVSHTGQQSNQGSGVAQSRTSGTNDGPDEASSDSGLFHSEPMIVDEDFYLALEEHWKKTFAKQHAELTEEHLDPPETWNDFHMETPHMLKVESQYFREHPQVWQTSKTPPGSERWDAEAQEARRLGISLGIYKTRGNQAASQSP